MAQERMELLVIEDVGMVGTVVELRGGSPEW